MSHPKGAVFETFENNKRATNYIKILRNGVVDGKTLTFRQIADKLNKEGYRTAKGKLFLSIQVQRIYKGYNQVD